MKIITRTLLGLSLPALLLATGSSYATARLQAVDTAMQSSGKSTLRLHFDSKVSMPTSFTMQTPANIVLDFPDTVSGMATRSKKFNAKSVKGVKLAGASKKLRVMISLNKLTKYTTSIQGNDVVLTFEDKQAIASKAAPQKKIVAKKVVKKSNASNIAKAAQAKSRARQQAQATKARQQGIARRQQAKAQQEARVKNIMRNRQVANQQRMAKARAAKLRDQNLAAGPVVTQKSVKHQAVASNYVARPAARPRVQAKAPYRATQQRTTYRPAANQIGAVDFHRTQKGGGRVIIKLPHASTKVETRKVGNVVVLRLKNVKAKQARKRIDVLDFATPASYIDVSRAGTDVEVRILTNSAFEFATLRKGNDFILNLNKKQRKITKNPLTAKKKVYKGKKLSLNFQDIEVRSVLQLLADFTDKNIVVSDSVKGNITLRLKDVPWDQALDIVLESKGLAMRNNGNVIWVAPAVELEAKEQRELQAYKRKQALEPLVTEYISVNYAKATDMLKLVKSSGGTNEGSLLSKRGSVTVDERTNTLLVQDTASNVSEIRNMVRNLDVTVRQVSIESRIVFATDEFSKELGARFGVTGFNSNIATSGGIGATNSIANNLVSGSGSVAIPSIGDRLNTNLPVAGAAGKLALSLLSKDFLLDLELSALQAEDKGEVISTPRVVTVDKKQASIEKGVDLPYLTESASGGTTVAFKKALLRLEVTPQITPDEHVIMDLDVRQDEREKDFISGNAALPVIGTRHVKTQVLVDNGQTVVLGGIHEEANISGVTKVPVLGDIPVIGNLFKKKTQKKNQRELLIFVTPKILK
ncbi:MAG: type IV pilus secretin PilQ [Cocleimonas sp.]